MYLQNVLIKPASSQCTMHCDYCFYCDEAAKRKSASYGMMSEETLRLLIKKVLFQAESDVCFAFQGGEPTLCGLPFFEKVVEYEQRFNRNHVRISNVLQTNGLQIDEAWCRFFRDRKFLIGISLDGIQKTHDQFRHTKAGAPTYERILQSVNMLEAFQVEYNILTVVNACTAPHIREIYQNYREHGWKYQQYIACLDPIGEEAGKNIYSLTPQLYGQFLIDLFQLWYKDWKRGRAPFIREFENYIGILMGYTPEACAQRGICSIQCVVEADGSVYPCDFYVLDAYRLGNIKENKIEDFFRHPTAQAFIRDSLQLDSGCRSCRYAMLCRGGCRRTRVPFPDSDAYRSFFCESYQMFFDKTASQLQEIAVYLNPRKC